MVCAVSLVGQWVDEAIDKTGGSLRIAKYHGETASYTQCLFAGV